MLSVPWYPRVLTEPDRPTLGAELQTVLVIPSWYPSEEQPTAGIFIYQQVSALAEEVDTAVLYVSEAPEAAGPSLRHEDGITVARSQLRMPRAARGPLRRIRAAARKAFNKFYVYPRAGMVAYELLRAEWGDPDIVHVQALWPAGLIARAIKRKYRIPYVVTEHSEEYSAASERRLVRVPGMVPLVLRPLSREASRTIAVSHFLGGRLAELQLAERPIVIPNVVPLCEALQFPDASQHVITHVSVMGPAKNLPALLRAVDLLRDRRDDFRLRLVGDGELRGELEQLVGSLNLGDVVEFAGRMSDSDVRSAFAGSAFTVVSSLHETFSVVAAESLMCGRPVLSTRCGGPEEFITPAVGRLIEPGSTDALVEGLDWMLDHYTEFDPQLLHQYARQRFAPEVVAKQIVAVYREVLDG